MKSPSLSKEFWIGALIGGTANFTAVNWATIWLLLGFLGVGMSSQPTDELQQTFASFIGVAACCPIFLNVILLAVGVARRKPPFLGGCLTGLLLNLLIPICWSAMLAALLALNIISASGFQP